MFTLPSFVIAHEGASKNILSQSEKELNIIHICSKPIIPVNGILVKKQSCDAST